MESNGRVQLVDVGSAVPFEYGGDQPVSAGMDHQLKTSPVARLFFSRKNVDALQDGIRYKVWLASQRTLVIGRQSDVELGLIMRSIYLQYAVNMEHDVVEQVRVLNVATLDFCVPRVMQEASVYARYRKDVSTMPMPMAWGEFASMKGTRVLEQKAFF
jgi:hypothetical protein